LERELAPFAEQARAKARAKAMDTARATVRDDESELSDLRSSDFEGLDETGGVTALITAVITDTVAATADRITDRFAGLRVNLRTASATEALANM
jgi:hypothetical protein